MLQRKPEVLLPGKGYGSTAGFCGAGEVEAGLASDVLPRRGPLLRQGYMEWPLCSVVVAVVGALLFLEAFLPRLACFLAGWPVSVVAVELLGALCDFASIVPVGITNNPAINNVAIFFIYSFLQFLGRSFHLLIPL